MHQSVDGARSTFEKLENVSIRSKMHLNSLLYGEFNVTAARNTKKLVKRPVAEHRTSLAGCKNVYLKNSRIGIRAERVRETVIFSVAFYTTNYLAYII